MNTIRNRILGALAVTALIPLVVLYLLTESMIRNAILDAEIEKVDKLNAQLAHHVRTLMESFEYDLRALQSTPVFVDKDVSSEFRVREMHRLVAIYDFFSDISLYDTDGYLVDSTVEDHPTYRDYSQWFKEALEYGEPAISQPHRQLGKRGLTLSVYLPVRQTNGEIENVIQARVSFDRVSRLVQSVRFGEKGRIILLDNWGSILSGADDERLLTRLDPSRELVNWAAIPSDRGLHIGGTEYLSSVMIISKQETKVQFPWGLVALQPMDEINELLRDAHIVLLIATIATLFGAITIGLLVSARISKPLVNLSQTAQSIAQGDLTKRVEPTGSTEIRDLSQSFNQMVSDLREYHKGLEELVDTRTHSLKQSRREHEETSAHLKAALEGSNNGFLVEDLQGKIIAVNQLFLDLFELSRSQVTGHRIDEVLKSMLSNAKNEEDTKDIRDAITNPEITADQQIVVETPALRYLDVHSAPIRDKEGVVIGRVWTLRDNTENRRLEDSLRQSQKMEAIGQLAGGVAHDFNNLLTGILGNLSLIELDSSPRKIEKNRDLLHRAISASDRAAELVKNLLGFSRRSHMDLKPTDTNSILDEVRGLLSATIDPSIRIQLDLEESLWGVMADPNLLSQVIMNMGVNAKDALTGNRKDGCIRLISRNRSVSKEEAKRYSEISAGDYVSLSVEDNGEGIPSDVQKRIFEPFFTTKEQGKGTGLGLATSFGIVKQLGGCVHFETEAGKGTRFDVLLPRSVVAEAQPPQRAQAKEKIKTPEERRETLLLVDDEDLVRSVGVSVLEKLGYRTFFASSGEEALEIYGKHEDEIDLIVLDLTMPGLSGKETFSELRTRFDHVPVLICSGYLVDVKEIEKECGHCPDGFIPKPYQVESMSDTIEEILEADPEKAA